MSVYIKFQINAETDEKFMMTDFLQNSYTLAAELQELGCTKNTIVGVVSKNRFEYAIVVLATMLTGATFTALACEYSLRL